MASIKPQTGGRELVLDGWRGLALLGVLVDHFLSREILNLGRFGVEFFFVLSGRLMAEILFIRRARLGEFFFRRFSRIYPVLFVFAACLYLLSRVFPDIQITTAAFSSVLTLTENYFSVLSMRTPDYDHIWSLCIEQHAYLILGLIAWVCRSRGWSPLHILTALILLAIVDGMISTWVFHLKYNKMFWRTDVRGASILMGAAVYLVLHDPARRPAFLRGASVPLVAGAAALLLNLNVVPDPIKYSLGTALLALSLATIEQAPAAVLAVLSSRALVAIGVVSYSLYVWQEPFAEIEDWTRRLLSLPLALAVGIASFFIVERPARRLLNRLWPHRRESRPPTAPAEAAAG